MTRTLPPDVARIGDLLVHMAGGYLNNTLREPGSTCDVCAAPVADQTLCTPCQSHADTGTPKADRVASLIYAVAYDTQAYKLVRNYKGVTPGPSQRAIMRSLLALGLRGHSVCALKLAGQPVGRTGWSVVPSTRGRATLRQLVAGLARRAADEVLLTPSAAAGAPRRLDPDAVTVSSPPPHPQHVILVDDSWVSGGHAQSAAAALKAAGVEQVSTLTVARILNPAWGPNPHFISQRMRADFNPSTCPWTGDACP